MALVGIELETLVSEPDALTTRTKVFQQLKQKCNKRLLTILRNQFI